MLPVHKLAAEILVWGILFGFSTLIFLLGGWPAVGGMIVFGWLLLDRVGMFKFTWENTMGSMNESD